MNPKDIILIYPKTGMDTPDTISLPLALLLISGRLGNDPGYKINIIDQKIKKNWKERLKERILSSEVLAS